MIYAIERKYATKQIGVRCRVKVGLFIEPTLKIGDSGFFMQADRDGTFTLFDPRREGTGSGGFLRDVSGGEEAASGEGLAVTPSLRPCHPEFGSRKDLCKN
jgi:hypothetical protein